jgi:hypothetical protein
MSHQPGNILAGTQVVSLVEVRGTNHSLVHPRGAVGVVTRTPTGDQNWFLIEARREMANHEGTPMNASCRRTSRGNEAQTERAESPKDNSPGQAK